MIKESIIGKHNPNPQKLVKDKFNIYFYNYHNIVGEDFFESKSDAYMDIRGAFNSLYRTLKNQNVSLNHLDVKYSDLLICWSDKDQTSTTPKIIIEHGWLPRTSFQISPTGANALGHYAKKYEFMHITDNERNYLLRHLTNLRKIFEQNIDLNKVEKLKQEIKKEFILFPFQLANDFNLKYSNTIFADYYETEADENHKIAQECMNLTEKYTDNIKVIFKQHPVDKTENFIGKVDFNKEKNSLILNEHKISITELFLTGLCKGVISINSNTIHEALLWNIPSICLGTLIWNEETVKNNRPFENDLSKWEKAFQNNIMENSKVLSYINHILKNQWYLSDFQNTLIVQELIKTKGLCSPYELRKEFGFWL